MRRLRLLLACSWPALTCSHLLCYSDLLCPTRPSGETEGRAARKVLAGRRPPPREERPRRSRSRAYPEHPRRPSCPAATRRWSPSPSWRACCSARTRCCSLASVHVCGLAVREFLLRDRAELPRTAVSFPPPPPSFPANGTRGPMSKTVKDLKIKTKSISRWRTAATAAATAHRQTRMAPRKTGS